MNDLEIRHNFHRKKLRKQHAHQDTIVVDELGLNHGKNRADIAVINGLLVGYEIKSNNDTLIRLDEQIKSYNSIFDKAYVVVGDRYINSVSKYLPDWWGIIEAAKGVRSAINFNIIRKASMNKSVNPISVARLLWRDEAAEILGKKQLPPKVLRQPRAVLYEYLADILNLDELRTMVKVYLKSRNNWRCRESLSRYGG